MDNSTSTQEQSKVCFLSGATSAKRITADVRSVLQDLHITVRTSEDLAPGSDVGQSLIEAVLSADFVCVVLSTRKPPLAVMYEAGVAAGSLRPLIVVADSKVADELPTQLISSPVIRYMPGFERLLRENLRAYVEQVQPIAAQLTVNWNSLRSLSSNVGRSQRSFDESRPEGRVAARLADAGALVASEVLLPGNLRADIMATFPILGSEFVPIIVEVKSSVSDFDMDLQQLRSYLRAAGARLGMIVYNDSGLKPLTKIYGPVGILRLSINDLSRWDNKRLIEEITKLRNQVVHSVR